MDRPINMNEIELGVCYYPEHWKRELWGDDLRRMKEQGIATIRIAEFAWTIFEKEEGVYSFDFFDDFMVYAKNASMRVIFCTPSATPPVWLTTNYPEVLNATIDGLPMYHGMRRHYNYNSPKYRQSVSAIVEQLAKHYGNHPNIIGWQIDNELNCEINVFYSESDHLAFREYMRKKYKTLDALNEAMGTVFWNQTYTQWEQIYLTRRMPHMSNNPHMALEEKRFISESTISFCKMQADILRKYCDKRQFITTNGLFGHIDNKKMTEDALDFFMFDSYPNFAYDVHITPGEDGMESDFRDRRNGFSLTNTRALSSCFGVMEQQSGGGGWDTRIKQSAPKPGQLRLWTMQSAAHGADFISYFRWRTCSVGTEIYWFGLNDYSNTPNRRLAEQKKVADDIQNIKHIAGSKYKADIVLLRDYDNEWDGEQDQWHGPISAISHQAWYEGAQLCHTPMDVLFFSQSPGGSKLTLEDISRYKLAVYPHAAILTEETSSILRKYAEGGGKIIFGARCGYKDIYGRCPMVPLPGNAADLCGVTVTDYTHLSKYDGDEWIICGEKKLPAPHFNDILAPLEQTETIGRYSGNYYDRACAVTKKKHGTNGGEAYYFGGVFTRESVKFFIRLTGLSEQYRYLFALPEELEIAVRVKDGKRYFFILNYKPEPVWLTVKMDMRELLSGKVIVGDVEIEKYGVFVFTDVLSV